MSIVIAYDLTRLFLAPCHQTPRGIDRIDIALAEHFFRLPDSPHLGILPTPWGIRTFSASVVRRGLNNLSRLWSEGESGHQVKRITNQITELFTHHPAALTQARIPQQRLSWWAKVRRMAAHLRATGIHAGKCPIRHLPPRTAYLNVGQIGLAVPMFFNWLDQRRDIACIMMLHDVIPLEYPHLVSKNSVKHHAQMIKTAARHADALILTTDHARQSVSQALSLQKRSNLPTLVRALPLHNSFVQAQENVSELAGHDYFITISTIEPRKNHALLISVWQKMIASMGLKAPHLLIVGAYGRDADLILSPLGTDPLLRSRIHVLSGLASPQLARLVLGARGMLCPSIAEGFGLSVQEGNAMGVPTIASDISAHREIANADTKLLPIDDVENWYRAICAIPKVAARAQPIIPHSMTEDGYAADIQTFISSCIQSMH